MKAKRLILAAIAALPILASCSKAYFDDYSDIIDDFDPDEYMALRFDVSDTTGISDGEVEAWILIDGALYSGSLERQGSTCNLFYPASAKVGSNATVYISGKKGKTERFLPVIRVSVSNGSASTGRVSYPYEDLLDDNGSGTSSDPFTIGSMIDFRMLSAAIQDDQFHGRDVYFRLDSDIDFSSAASTENVTPIRVGCYGTTNYGSPFCGTFDGNGKTLSGYYVKFSPDNGNGLFYKLGDGATVRNLKFEKVRIETATSQCGALAGSTSGSVTVSGVSLDGTLVSGANSVGGLIGEAVGALDISSCSVSNAVIKTYSTEADPRSGQLGLGGIIGRLAPEGSPVKGSKTWAKFTGNTVSDDVTVSGYNSVGALIGEVDAEGDSYTAITGCTSKCQSVSGNTEVGMFGHLKTKDGDEIFIKNVGSSLSPTTYSGVEISAKGKVGGLVGYAEAVGGDIILQDSKSGGNVSGQSYVGGAIGTASGSGRVIVTNVTVVPNGYIKSGGSDCGGLIGQSTVSTLELSSSSNECAVSCGNSYAGGLIGYIKGGNVSIYGCYNSAAVTGKKYVGGLVGAQIECTSEISGCNGTGSITEESSVGKVSATDSYVGGGIGYVEGGKASFTAKGRTMQTGHVGDSSSACDYTGGLVGMLKDGALVVSGSPSAILACSVFGKDYTGGAVGYSSGGSLELNNISFEGNGVYGSGNLVGGIVGASNSDYTSIGGCSVSSEVKGTDFVGGCIGMLYAISGGTPVANFTLTSDGSVSGGKYVSGGIGAVTSGKFGSYLASYIFNRGTVTGTSYVGGCIGYFDGEDSSAAVQYLYNYGKVTNNSNDSENIDDCYVGGCVGRIHDYGTIQFCANYGEVYSRNCGKTGGIVGGMGYGLEIYCHFVVKRCFNAGNIHSATASAKNTWIGGIAGYTSNALASSHGIFDCYNIGKVEGTYAGGILGREGADVRVYRCYHKGPDMDYPIIRYHKGNGVAATYASNNYSSCDDHDSSGNTYFHNAEKLTAEQFKDTLKFKTWDFHGVWSMRNDRPQLDTNFED